MLLVPCSSPSSSSLVSRVAQDTISLLSDVFDAAEDPIFSQLVEALSQLSENCVPFLIRALINWKSNQQFLASQTFKPPAYI